MTNIDTKRLANDLDYWNEVAPEGAEWVGLTPTQKFCWYRNEDGRVMFMYESSRGLWHFCAGEPVHKASIHRPAPKWSGDGLPPVGVECEMDNARRQFVPVEIIAEKDGYRIGWHAEGRQIYFSDDPADFHPLPTEKDKVVEAAMKHVAGALSCREALEDAYDTGFLRMPEEE